MPTIYIDNKPYEVKAGQNLLHACLSLGFDIPYFCWHPALNSVGACRMCAVKQFKDENDTKGKIVMSCMTPASDGVRISIDDPEAVKFRKSVIEWLMLNHPHDCPVCDEGGECHLQDMTVMAGHTYRRNRFKKRTYADQNLGPFVRHEMNRCIQCYRCVRFYLDYAGGKDMNVFGWHDRVYFGKNRDGLLKSEFSGNLIEICPTGVFTDKTLYKHFTRKWDMQSAPSVCTHCSLGCNIIGSERYGKLRRILNRFNSEVNGYFNCDRGRFGYEYVNSSKRLRKILMRNGKGELKPACEKTVIDKIAEIIRRGRVIGIGSGRASLESNFALRTLVGAENFYAGASAAENSMVSEIGAILRNGRAKAATLNEVGMADAVLVLGEDVLNAAPMLGLALRQSILQKPLKIIKELGIEPWNDAAVREVLQQEKGPLYIAATQSSGLDDAAAEIYRSAPVDLARLGFAVAHKLNNQAPAVGDLSEKLNLLAGRIADALKNSERPLVIAGTSLGSRAIIKAAANIVQALCVNNTNTRICFTVPSCNSIGLELLGSKSIDGAIEAAAKGDVDTIIILENDIYRHIGDETAEKILNGVDNVIVIDSIQNKTVDKAHIVLPAATFAESSGTFVNNEARAQRFFRVLLPTEDIRESWKWIRDIILSCGLEKAEKWHNLDGIIKDIANNHEIFKAISDVAKPSDFRVAGQKIPRQTQSYSGRTAVYADVDVNEPQPPFDEDSPLSFSMEGFPGRPPAFLISHYWAPYWNSVQSVNKYQKEVGGPIRGGDDGRRLLEPSGDFEKKYFTEIPEAFKIQDGQLLIVPSYHIFGSEKLSSLSPSIAELSPKPFIAVNPQDAGNLKVNSDRKLEIVFSNVSYYLPIKVDSSVPKGMALVPMGLDGLQWDGVPVWRKLLKRENK